MKVDTDQKQARNTQQTTNWQRENNDAGNNLAWHAASATGSRTYMGHRHTGVHTSYTEDKDDHNTIFVKQSNHNAFTPGLNTCRKSLRFPQRMAQYMAFVQEHMATMFMKFFHRQVSTTRIYRTARKVSAEKETQLQSTQLHDGPQVKTNALHSQIHKMD